MIATAPITRATECAEAPSAPPTLDAQLGRRLQQARKDCDWSQKRLAAHLHIDPSAVSRMESGHQSISLALAVKIAEALGVSVLELTRPPSVIADVQEALTVMQSAVRSSRRTLASALAAAHKAREALNGVSETARRGITGDVPVQEFLARKVSEAAGDHGGVAAVGDRDENSWLASLVHAIAQGVILADKDVDNHSRVLR